MNILDLQDLSKSYPGAGHMNGSVQALDRVSVALAPGDFLAVQGPSGCGKTTLLLMAGGLLEPTAGSARILGQDPYALPPERRARFRAETIGFVFQQFHLVPYLSVLDNVRAPALASGRPEAAARAAELIAQFGLEHRAHHVPAELSTGERQRTALARSLLNRPKLLLADEPTGNLDRANGEVVLAAFAAFAREGGAVLLVSHDDHAVQQAARVMHMRDGRVV